jgi:hypothetical protein
MILARFAISLLAIALLACAVSYSQADQNSRASPASIGRTGE